MSTNVMTASTLLKVSTDAYVDSRMFHRGHVSSPSKLGVNKIYRVTVLTIVTHFIVLTNLNILITYSLSHINALVSTG